MLILWVTIFSEIPSLFYVSVLFLRDSLLINFELLVRVTLYLLNNSIFY